MTSRVKNEYIKDHPQYMALHEAYEELCSYTSELNRENERAEKELSYLQDFVRHKGLEEEYLFFRKHAVPDPSEDLPFPHYVLIS